MGISFAGTKLHKLFVERNSYVKNEYENYIKVNSQNKKRNRGREWIFLIRANIAYAILNRSGKGNTIIESYPTEMENIVESKEIKNPHWQAMELLKYEVISFDIFDTLVFRPFDNPKTLFIIVGEKLNILNFYSIRINAEKKARDIKFATYGNREVSIFDIYDIISRKTGIDAEKGAMCEIETELEFCIANPYMKELYDLLKFQGKKMIAVSDMYLPETYIKKILEKCGYDYFENVIVSCDCQMSKANGDIYSYVLNKCNCTCDKLVHIGDNENGDIKQAEKNHIKTVFYENVNKACCYRPTNMSPLIGSSYKGIVNYCLHNGLKKYTPAYEYGFTVGGLYVTGFCNWIHKRVEEKKIDKIFFLARDGDIYIKIYNKMFPDNNSEYVYWSRISAILSTAKYEREAFINNFVYSKVSSVIRTSVLDLLKSLGLEKMVEKIGLYGLREDVIISEKTKELVASLFIDNWKDVIESFDERTRLINEYIKRAIGSNKKIAIVDVGWTGSNVMKLQEIIENEISNEVKVTCFLAGYTATTSDYKYSEGTIESYIFSNQNNRDLYEMHHIAKKPTNNLFEILTQAQMPSFIGFNKEGMEFDIPEVENYEQISAIQNGIIDFNNLWMKTFDKYPYMFNISGRDAYLPFSQKIKNIDWFKRAFPDFTVSLKVMSNREKQVLETIKEIL